MPEESKNLIIAVVTASFFVLLFGFVMVLVVLSFLRSKKKMILERKIREAEMQQELLQAQLEMQEHTFKTVSQEIHDNVGQILSLAKVNLSILGMENGGNAKLQDITDLVGKAIRELRALSAGYYADRLLEDGLLTAIRHELEQLEKTGLFTTSFLSQADTLRIDKDKLIFLYRMIQEVFNNIVKHSGAIQVSVNIFKQDTDIQIMIKDNGKGFSRHREDFKPGIGLSSMEQRAAMIGAQVAIHSDDGKGTIVNLVFKENNYD